MNASFPKSHPEPRSIPPAIVEWIREQKLLNHPLTPWQQEVLRLSLLPRLEAAMPPPRDHIHLDLRPYLEATEEETLRLARRARIPARLLLPNLRTRIRARLRLLRRRLSR
jgi:hypothetical protein